MNLAYVLCAHNHPDQLGRLASAIYHEEDLFVIHIDSKVKIDPFVSAVADAIGHGPNVHWVERVRVDWGGFGLVRAALDSLAVSLALDRTFTHAVLLSGQDYPIKPVDRIRNQLLEHPGQSFMSWSAGDGSSPGDQRGNLHWFWSGDLGRLNRRYYLFGRRWIALPNHYLPFWPTRAIPGGLKPYQGLAYWCLSREAARYVVEFTARRPDILRFFRRVHCPEENYFQMVLLDSPLRHTIVNEDLRFMNWQGWHPKVLLRDDLPDLAQSPKLFARKFDTTVDPWILDLIDSQLLS